MLANFTRVYADALEILRVLTFNGQSNVHRVVTSLYATIMEQAHDTLTLLHDGNQSTVDIILRSSLEAYADLINLTNSEAYLGNMNASYHYEWIRMAEGGLQDNNQWMQAFANEPGAQEQLDAHRTALAALAATPRLSVWSKLQKANLGSMYASVYNNLCSESHNNLRSLTARHFRLVDGQYQMTYLADRDQESLDASLMLYAGIVVDSTAIVNNYFGSPADDAVRAMQSRHAASLAAKETEIQAAEG